LACFIPDYFCCHSAGGSTISKPLMDFQAAAPTNVITLAPFNFYYGDSARFPGWGPVMPCAIAAQGDAAMKNWLRTNVCKSTDAKVMIQPSGTWTGGGCGFTGFAGVCITTQGD
jgi:hypothetical protein